MRLNILIIGSGWLGQPLTKTLMQSGHTVTITSTQQTKVDQLKADGFNVIKYNLGQAINNHNAFFSRDLVIIATTCKQPHHFVGISEKLNKLTKHLIYISSTSVYQNNGEIHDEGSKNLDQESPILEIEHTIQQHPSATIVRFAGLVGPQRHPGRFFQQGRKVKSPAAPVNLIHLDDCIGIIHTIIDQHAWNQIFNGCADNHPAKFVYYTQMASQLDFQLPEFDENTTGSHKIIDNQNSKSVLGYSYKYPDVMNMTF